MKAKGYIHARLSERDRSTLETLRAATGLSESDLVRRGLELVSREVGGAISALDLAGTSVGRFRGGPKDLSANPEHLDGFGQ